jgi:GT2 family glycosyltransferase
MQWPVEMLLAVKPDVVVWQRHVEDGQLEVMRRAREALPDALFVYELDDYLGELPAASFHAGFMPPDLPGRIRRAILHCDRVTVSTEPLARWFRAELGAKDVRVVGNAVPGGALRPREGRATGRLRVGFVGGISHDGDLELIRPAMREIGDEVEWVFFGSQIKNPPVHVEFHPGVAPGDYQARMLGLDLDLMLAPLEDNRFNRCKSNLRVLEAGMIGACAIAQRLDPYLDGAPPVFAYAETPDEWTQAIRAFMVATAFDRSANATALQGWVARHHTLEQRLPQRIDAWLRRGGESAWHPAKLAGGAGGVVLSLAEGCAVPVELARLTRRTSLEDACAWAAQTESDVLWLRPGTTFGDNTALASLRQALGQADTVAAAVPLATDGPNAFPRKDNWTPVSASALHAVQDSLHQSFAGRRLAVPAPSGPCVLLSARALAALGLPDVRGCDGHEEQAVMEWGLRAALKEWRVMQAVDVFAASAMPPAPPGQPVLQRLQLRGYAEAFKKPGESLTDQERVGLEMDLLRAEWRGPLPGTMGFGHDYASWSALRGPLLEPPDGKQVMFVLPFGASVEDVHIVPWVVFTDDTVEWHENGVEILDRACREAPDGVVAIYGDNDMLGPDGGVYPDLKSDFDLELFLARDYVTQVCAVRVSAFEGHDFTDRTALYAALLRLTERFGGDPRLGGRCVIRHLPQFLATVREMTGEEAAVSAIGRQMAVEGQYCGEVDVSAHLALPGVLSVRRNWNANPLLKTNAPLVSIIVPTLGAGRLIQPCINTIRQHTDYPNYEIIVAQNGAREAPELGEAALADPRVRVVRIGAADWKFNWSALNNEVVREHARGGFLCFMNDDICVGTPHWLDAMMGHAVRPDVGVVGARLVHPGGVVQHAGVVCHLGIAGHLYKGLPNGHPGNGWLALLTHEASAVTGACMLVSRENFDRVGGFDAESFPMNYGDTDLCLKMREIGLRNVVEAATDLLHPEGTSRTDPGDMAGFARRLQDDNARFAARWPGPDPYWHPLLSIGLSQGGMSISGLNRDMLAWDRPVVRDDAPRVLLVNDRPGLAGHAVACLRKGEVCLAADVNDFALRLTAPIPANVGAWDVRSQGSDLAAALKRLGIARVVVCSFEGTKSPADPASLMRCLGATGLTVDLESAAGRAWAAQEKGAAA